MADNCIALKATKHFFKKKNIKLSECVFHGCAN
jgi:hypothetical protein